MAYEKLPKFRVSDLAVNAPYTITIERIGKLYDGGQYDPCYPIDITTQDGEKMTWWLNENTYNRNSDLIQQNNQVVVLRTRGKDGKVYTNYNYPDDITVQTRNLPSPESAPARGPSAPPRRDETSEKIWRAQSLNLATQIVLHSAKKSDATVDMIYELHIEIYDRFKKRILDGDMSFPKEEMVEEAGEEPSEPLKTSDDPEIEDLPF